MKKSILSLLLTTLVLHVSAKTWTVVSSGMTFSPETTTIQQGDSVKFVIDGSHNAVEVNQTVWNANGSTANGGFSIPFGGGTALPAKLTVGTHYYVCTPHVGFGMKGRIVVQAATSLSVASEERRMNFFRSLGSNDLNIHWNFSERTSVRIDLYDLQGKMMLSLLPATELEGNSTAPLHMSKEIKAGLYLVRIMIGKSVSFEKVLI